MATLAAEAEPVAASARPFVPDHPSLGSLREAAAGCRGCDLYTHATQTVFGEGPARARLMFVGEQPGDSEDVQSRPFVGPAGKLLRSSFEKAGISAKDAYITNAVKHACAPWLEAEIALTRPELVVALGATAAQALLGGSFRLTQHRQEVLSSHLAPRVAATVHPSSILRADEDSREREIEAFVEDLRWIAGLLE